MAPKYVAQKLPLKTFIQNDMIINNILLYLRGLYYDLLSLYEKKFQRTRRRSVCILEARLNSVCWPSKFAKRSFHCVTSCQASITPTAAEAKASIGHYTRKSDSVRKTLVFSY